MDIAGKTEPCATLALLQSREMVLSGAGALPPSQAISALLGSTTRSKAQVKVGSAPFTQLPAGMGCGVA